MYSVAAFVIVIAMVSFACSYLMTETLRTGLRNEEPTPVGRSHADPLAPHRGGIT